MLNICSYCYSDYYLTSTLACVDSKGCPNGTYAELSTFKCKACDTLNCAICEFNICSYCNPEYYLTSTLACVDNKNCPAGTFADFSSFKC